MRVALVHDWLDVWGGGEAVLAGLVQLFPNADVFTLVDFLSADEHRRLGVPRTVTSPLQRLPAARRWFRYAAALRPQIIERFDLSGYDLVISDSHAVAKGARTRPGQLHVCYCHTPARFAWSMEGIYADRATEGSAWRRPLVRRALARFRDWDCRANSRINRFIANSRYTSAAIARCYGRDAAVVYPPVDIGRFAAAGQHAAGEPAGDAYVTVSRLVPYKRIEILVEAFRDLPARKLLVIGDGPERARLAARSAPNVEFAGRLDDAAVARHVAQSRAFLFAAEEDFGIAPIEAQAAGTPVIAFARGGVFETVRGLGDSEPTGVFFDAQSPGAVCAAVLAFEAQARRITRAACRENAARYSTARFHAEILKEIDTARARPTHAKPLPGTA
jgi:glycosyltransferase involved in cell wall biosynthesis